MNNIEEKKNLCLKFFDELCEKLKDSYELLPSCNQDISAYLCPNGTTELVTYESKPDLSFRISDHWNWFANVKKCPDEHYIQCFSKDLPWTKKRKGDGLPSYPVKATCVCMFIDGSYKVIYGETFNRKTKTWSWMNNDVDNVIYQLNERLGLI